MEKDEPVRSVMKGNSQGSERIIYSLKKTISLTNDISSHLFRSRFSSFTSKPKKEGISEDSTLLMDGVDEIVQYTKAKRIRSFMKMLNKTDIVIDDLLNKRDALLHFRNSSMNEAYKMTKDIEDPNARRVLHHILNEKDRNNL